MVAEILLQPLTRIYPTRRYSKFDYEYLWPNKLWTLPDKVGAKKRTEDRNIPMTRVRSTVHPIVNINKIQNNSLHYDMEDEDRPVGESENDDNVVADIDDDKDTEHRNTDVVPDSQMDVGEGVGTDNNSSEDHIRLAAAREGGSHHLTVNRQYQKNHRCLDLGEGDEQTKNAVAQVHANNAILALQDLFASDDSKDDSVPVVTPQKVDFLNRIASKDPDVPFPETEVDDDPSTADFEKFFGDDMSMLYGEGAESQLDDEGVESQLDDESSLVTTSQKRGVMTPPSVNTDTTVVSNKNKYESGPVLLHDDNDYYDYGKPPYEFHM